MKKIRLGAGILIAFLLFAIAGVVYFILLGQWHTAAYAAGNSNEVSVFRIAEPKEGEEPAPEEAGKVIRGSEVMKYLQNVTVDGVTYNKISSDAFPDEQDLYMEESSLADNLSETVKETEVFARSPATIYKTAGEPDIASFAPKGTHLKVTGHDRLLDNGYIKNSGGGRRSLQ